MRVSEVDAVPVTHLAPSDLAPWTFWAAPMTAAAAATHVPSHPRTHVRDLGGLSLGGVATRACWQTDVYRGGHVHSHAQVRTKSRGGMALARVTSIDPGLVRAVFLVLVGARSTIRRRR